jgi:hypothetical protein
MIKHLFMSVAFFLYVANFVYADGNCTKSSTAIIKVFDQGIALNEKYKKSVASGDPTSYRQLRVQVEKLNEENVIPCVERAGEILSTLNEPRLVHKLLQLVVSYENSADETISYSLGLIFGANPQMRENALKRFTPSESKLIVERLEGGWLNAKSNFKKEVIKDRKQRLQKLHF